MPILKHLLIALGLGAVTFCLVIFAAWLEIPPQANRYTQQGHTRELVHWFAARLTAYMKEHDAPPRSLDDLESRATDSWDRPLQFEMTDAGPIVFSLGRDGIPGGKGPDTDLYSDDRNLHAAHPTLGQFLTNDVGYPVMGFVISALIAGGIVALTAFRILRHEFVRDRPVRFGKALFEILVVVVFSTLAGIWLLALHIPSGH